jgi:hypothetical protein
MVNKFNAVPILRAASCHIKSAERVGRLYIITIILISFAQFFFSPTDARYGLEVRSEVEAFTRFRQQGAVSLERLCHFSGWRKH